MTPEAHLTLQQIFNSLPIFYQHLLGAITYPTDQGKAITDNIRAAESIGASDGSCINHTLASFAVKLSPRNSIADHPNPEAFIAVNGVDGAPGHISSLRAESRGGIATILMCIILYKKWQRTSTPSISLQYTLTTSR